MTAMVDEPGLFPEPERTVPLTKPVAEMGADARRTRRQMIELRDGNHPIGLVYHSVLPLHRDAPPVDDREAPGPRCGNCVWLRRKRQTASYLKCHKHMTNGPGTDLRAWWPGCMKWQAQ